MSEEEDGKGLATEQLPAPSTENLQRTPRERTAEHLRRIVAAAGLALGLPGAASADSSVPPTGKNDGAGGKDAAAKKKDDGKKKPSPPPEPDPGYFVVDMMPEPADIPKPPQNEKPKMPTGWLDLTSMPPASIRVDGADSGLKTPQHKLILSEGTHTITLVDDKGKPLENFTVRIHSATTLRVVKDLRPKAAPVVPKK